MLVGAEDARASVVRLSAREVILETSARPAIGTSVALAHPEAGTIAGVVDAHGAGGITLRLDGGEHAVAFALAAIMSDMSRAA